MCVAVPETSAQVSYHCHLHWLFLHRARHSPGANCYCVPSRGSEGLVRSLRRSENITRAHASVVSVEEGPGGLALGAGTRSAAVDRPVLRMGWREAVSSFLRPFCLHFILRSALHSLTTMDFCYQQ